MKNISTTNITAGNFGALHLATCSVQFIPQLFSVFLKLCVITYIYSYSQMSTQKSHMIMDYCAQFCIVLLVSLSCELYFVNFVEFSSNGGWARSNGHYKYSRDFLLQFLQYRVNNGFTFDLPTKNVCLHSVLFGVEA